MRVSVIIVNYNGKHHLAECIESLEAQSFRDFETILVDNDSSDGSLEFVKNTYPNVRILALSANTGYTGGNNAGIKAAAGECIFLLNNDTRLDRHCIEHLISAIDESDEEVIGVFPKALFHDEQKVVNACGVVWNERQHWRDNRCGLIDLGQFDSREKVFGSMFVAVLMKKDLFTKIGLFDEDFFSYGEDFDISYRAHVLGYAFVLEPRAVLFHKFRSSSSQETAPYWSHYFFLRNYCLVFLKNVEMKNLMRYFPCFARYLYGAFLVGVRNLLVSRDQRLLSTATKAFFSILAATPSSLRKRVAIQKRRRRSDKEFWNFDAVEGYNIFYYEDAIVLNILALRRALDGPQVYTKGGKRFTTL